MYCYLPVFLSRFDISHNYYLVFRAAMTSHVPLSLLTNCLLLGQKDYRSSSDLDYKTGN